MFPPSQKFTEVSRPFTSAPLVKGHRGLPLQYWLSNWGHMLPPGFMGFLSGGGGLFQACSNPYLQRISTAYNFIMDLFQNSANQFEVFSDFSSLTVPFLGVVPITWTLILRCPLKARILSYWCMYRIFNLKAMKALQVTWAQPQTKGYVKKWEKKGMSSTNSKCWNDKNIRIKKWVTLLPMYFERRAAHSPLVTWQCAKPPKSPNFVFSPWRHLKLCVSKIWNRAKPNQSKRQLKVRSAACNKVTGLFRIPKISS